MPTANTLPSKNAAPPNKLFVLLSTVLVAILVALTYYYFEAAVRHSINYIWDALLNTGTRRALVVPACIVGALIFFGLQHYLDPASETHESHGLGETPSPTLTNFVKVLGIGFFSLVAGASLGPEAILVPACIIVGGYIGAKLFRSDEPVSKLLGMVGFIALLAAFFHSFIVGMLGLLLVTKQVKIKLNVGLVVIAAIASLVTVLVLQLLTSSPYVRLPPAEWKISLAAAVALVALLFGGYAVTYLLNLSHDAFQKIHAVVANRSWWLRGLVAAAGLAILYLLGGPLVEFTGNESVVPMLQQSAALGLLGLLWLFVIKILAIGWSKTLSYRGGLVFPSIFVASVLVAIAQLYVKDLSFTVGLITVMVGVIAANTKVKILF